MLLRHQQDILFESLNNDAIEQAEYRLFQMLKPTLSKDGNQWCVLYGDNIQEGIAGFGNTPYLAILNWNKQWNIN